MVGWGVFVWELSTLSVRLGVLGWCPFGSGWSVVEAFGWKFGSEVLVSVGSCWHAADWELSFRGGEECSFKSCWLTVFVWECLVTSGGFWLETFMWEVLAGSFRLAAFDQ